MVVFMTPGVSRVFLVMLREGGGEREFKNAIEIPFLPVMGKLNITRMLGLIYVSTSLVQISS